MSMVEKIQKLIAKAESTPFQHEADTFMAKAQELMVQHAIDIALVEGITGIREEEITQVDFEVPMMTGRDDRIYLGCSIANSMGAYGFWSRAYTVGPALTIVGYPTDILNACTLWASLCMQLDIFYKVARENGDNIDPVTGERIHHRQFKAAFSQSFCKGVKARVRERYARAVEDAPQTAAIVLVDRADTVAKYVLDNYSLGKGQLGPRKGSAQGALAGMEAAARANISNGSHALGKTQLRLGR